MPQPVSLEGIGEVEFADDFTPEQVRAAVTQIYARRNSDDAQSLQTFRDQGAAQLWQPGIGEPTRADRKTRAREEQAQVAAEPPAPVIGASPATVLKSAGGTIGGQMGAFLKGLNQVLLSTGEPEGKPGEFAPPPNRSATEHRQLEQASPVHQLGDWFQGKAQNVLEHIPERQRGTVMTQMTEAVSGLAPVLAEGGAPVVFGLLKTGEVYDSAYDNAIEAGKTKEEAAKAAGNKAFLSGAKEAAVWQLGPPALKKFVGDRIARTAGTSYASRWLAETGAGGVTVGGTAAATTALQNAIEGKPLGEDVAKEAVAGFLLPRLLSPTSVGPAGPGEVPFSRELHDVLDRFRPRVTPRPAATAAPYRRPGSGPASYPRAGSPDSSAPSPALPPPAPPPAPVTTVTTVTTAPQKEGPDESLTPLGPHEQIGGPGAVAPVGEVPPTQDSGLRTQDFPPEPPATITGSNVRQGTEMPAETGESPVPESPATLAAQLDLVRSGTKPAMLVTPGAPMPEIPEGHATLDAGEQGTIIFDPRRISPATVQEAVLQGHLGTLLGYGSDQKPGSAGFQPAVLQTKNESGVPVQEEVITPATLPAAQAAAAKTVPGGTSEVVPAEQVIAERKTVPFIGNLKAGDVFESSQVLGNFDLKRKAEALAVQEGGRVESYLGGKYKRGWVVLKAVASPASGDVAPPLPAGEGRGEGEPSVNPSTVRPPESARTDAAPPSTTPGAIKVLKPANVDTAADIASAQAAASFAQADPGFSPKVAREQKKFLLDAIDQAITEAPESFPFTVHDAALATLADHKAWKSGDTSLSFTDRQKQALAPLFEAYDVKLKTATGGIVPSSLELLERAIMGEAFKLRPKVSIEIPGDGTFDIINTQAALKNFKERAGKFPTTSGQAKEPSKARTSATAPVPLGTRSAASTLKALEVAALSDPDRVAIHERVWSDGQQTVATNGRMLTSVQFGLGGTKENPKVFTLAGKEVKVDPEKIGERFPNWRQVLPEGYKFLLPDLSTEKLFTILRQAQEATSEKSSSVILWRNKDGSLGVTAKAPEVAEYVHNRPDPDSGRVIAAFDPKYLVAAINSARRVGDTSVSLEWIDELAPLKISSANTYSIIMPMRLSSPEAVARGGELGESSHPLTDPPAHPLTRSLDSPPALGRGGELGEEPPPRRPTPADDPRHSVFDALPMELPEAVQLVKWLTGLYPRIKERMGKAAGRFIFTEGEGGKGRIELKAATFDLLTPQEKATLRQEADNYAENNADDNKQRMADERYAHLLEKAYDEARHKNPVWALKVMWHEIGHLVDWLPEKMIGGRGNFFGRIASLKNYLHRVMPLDPAGPMGQKITPADKVRLQAEALRQLRDELGQIQEIVRTIIVEEPEWQITGITPEDVKNILRESAGKETPELTRWFAEQNSKVKAEVLRAAMKGFLDERLAALGGIKKQVGTRRVEKTVREKQGREPTPAELKQRFAEILAREMRIRNLADLKDVKAELEPLIAWWRGTEKMESYFASGEEMYAEAFSVFANNPAALEARAPTYAKLLWNYLDRKPQVRALYDQIQADIKAGNVMPNRVKGLFGMWDRDDAASVKQARDSTRLSRRDVLDNVSYHFDRRFGPVYRAAQGTDAAGRVQEAVGNFLYRMTEHERYLGAVNEGVGKLLVAHNLDWSHDLGEYLFHRRVTEERFNLANPLGWTSKNSFERLAEMQRTLGAQRWAALVDAGQRFQDLRKEFVVDPVLAEGMFSPELAKVLSDRADYATFSAIKDRADVGIEKILENQYGPGITPHIYRQIGNLGEIKNPATATMLKGLSLISATYRNSMKRETVRMLRQHHPEDIMPAKLRWNGKFREPVMEDGRGVGTVTFLQDGQMQAFYTRKVIADAVNSATGSDNLAYSLLLKATGWQKGIFTQLNYAFWPFNFVRDTLGWWMQMPGVATPFAWAKHLPRALLAARQSVTHSKPNPYADAALKRKMLISKGDPRGVWAAVENEYELKLASYGMEPAQWDRQATGVRSVVKAWDAYKNIGQTVERVNKIAGMLYLDEKFPALSEVKKREIVRERSGSPNFLERGASNPTADLLFLFYNPWKEGVRSVIHAARDNPVGFATKAAVLLGLPTILQSAAVNGWLGDDRKEQYSSIPDYDLTNYLVVPLGWVDRAQHKVAYLRLPLWEIARIAHGTLFQTLTDRGQGVMQHAGGQLPGLNPLWKIGLVWGEYMMGKNPVDITRGVNVLTDKQANAGGPQAAAQLAKYSWNELGGSILHRFQNLNLESAPTTEGENFLRLPIINNALGRWLKISDKGIADQQRGVGAEVDQHRAQVQLGVDQIMERMTSGEGSWQFAQGALAAGDQEAFARSVQAAQLTESERMLLRDPYALQYFTKKFPEVLGSQYSPLYRAWHKAGSNEERLELLKRGLLK